MAQEALTILRAGYAYNQIVWPGPTVNAVSAAGAVTQTGFDTGYLALKQKPGIPYGGMFLVLDIPGPISSTGASGSSTQVATVTFSDDGSTQAGYSHALAAIAVTYASSVGSVTNKNSQGVATGANGTVFYFRLPETRHAYIRVQLAAASLTTVTGINYGNITVAIQDEVDTEATISADLG